MRFTHLSSLVALPTAFVALLFVTGCPQEVELPDMHGFVPVAKTLDIPKDEGPKELPDRVKKEAALRRVEAMRTAFAEEKELTCKVDSDCTVMPQHCCGCSEGGRRVAVNRNAFRNVIQRRSAVCKDQSCRQIVSEDESCGVTKAKCVKNTCVLDMASVVKKKPTGVGVEPIKDVPATAPPNGAPPATK